MLLLLEEAFSPLGGKISHLQLSPRKKIGDDGRHIEFPLGTALSIVKRPHAKLRVLLNGHMDTVYSSDSPFQRAERLDANTLKGPGVADMKGGLLVMLKALELFEKSPFAEHIGWEVLINPDEEIGSVGSHHHLAEAAKRNHLGLIFEPSFPDGALVNARKGSANFTIVASGTAAHAGRDFHQGRNAIHALAAAICELSHFNKKMPHAIVNVGVVQGGQVSNIVPDMAFCRVNIRGTSENDLNHIIEKTKKNLYDIEKETEVALTLHLETLRPPKLYDKPTQELFAKLECAAKELDIPFNLRESGGASDGNILSAEGLPVIDSLGVVGGKIHTSDEYMFIPSLLERIKLTALFLMQLAPR